MRILPFGTLALALFPVLATAQVDVPLRRYRDASLPGGPNLGSTAGAAFVDYDADGWVDIYVHFNGRLLHNEEGLTWRADGTLNNLFPNVTDRYGATCGDYDNDGLPDIATEQRQSDADDCFRLLHNLGNRQFEEVADDPEIVLGQVCDMWSETGCWADFDDDGDLDLWITAYLDAATGGGNRFWENLGPTGPGGAYRLELRTIEAGLDIPPGVSRPEGAQVVDVDRDGDLDAYANGTLYKNVSRTRPLFEKLIGTDAGIEFSSSLDEGALFGDYDLDGDMDLFCLYIGLGNRLFENRGDGTFQQARGTIEQPFLGANQGSSLEDWDLDGDLDLTTTMTFRRNLMVEEGRRFFRLATHELGDNIQFASPAWADWDKDGDMDVLIANFRSRSFLYENTTYDRDTPALQKRSVRVRVARDHPELPRGLETEFGATVELRVKNDVPGRVYRRFVASSHGYLQQSEYELTFGLPPGPDPARPAKGVVFDVQVDFPSLELEGIWRIDQEINPVLGGLALASLTEREITVFRSGRVVIDGQAFEPREARSPRLTTTTDGLATAEPGAPLADPTPPQAGPWFVGLALDTTASSTPLFVRELVLDGGLAAPVDCGAKPFNVALWDVTTPARPFLAWQAALSTYERNRRHFLPVDFTLRPHRLYRLACLVDALRPSPIAGPTSNGSLRTLGGLSFSDSEPCSGAGASAALIDPDAAQVALRFRAPRAPRAR